METAASRSSGELQHQSVSGVKDRYADAFSRFTLCGGACVHYRDEGLRDGPPLILIHGLLSSLHTWDGWTRQLGQQYRVIRLDLPGFGLTGPWIRRDSPYTRDALVGFLREFLDQLKVDKCVLAGHSLGGWIAWEFACAYPDRVGKLILVSPAGYDLAKPPWIVRLARLPGIRALICKIMPRALTRIFVKSAYGNPKLVTPGTISRHHELFLRSGNREAFFRMIRQPLVAATERLRSLRIPTFLLWGDRDRWISIKNARRFMKEMTYATLKTYSGAGHLLAEELPQETGSDVVRFLRETG